jgi:hypothetical protein
MQGTFVTAAHLPSRFPASTEPLRFPPAAALGLSKEGRCVPEGHAALQRTDHAPYTIK